MPQPTVTSSFVKKSGKDENIPLFCAAAFDRYPIYAHVCKMAVNVERMSFWGHSPNSVTLKRDIYSTGLLIKFKEEHYTNMKKLVINE